jgi:hypothetical protein
MENKKTESRFNIRFNKYDPLHLHVAELINKQGRYGKTQYIVRAILHYENCNEMPGLKSPAKVDEKYIEAVVNRLLKNKEIQVKTVSKIKNLSITSENTSHTEPIDKIDIDDAIDTLGQDGINAIKNAMEMFRR